MTTDQNMPKRLRIIRNNLGISQSELAKLVGVEPPVISHYETGQRTPSLQVFRKLCHHLNVTAEFLFADDPIPHGHACPFCGEYVQDVKEDERGQFFTECRSCLARGPLATDKTDAVLAGRSRGNANEITAPGFNKLDEQEQLSGTAG